MVHGFVIVTVILKMEIIENNLIICEKNET
jgi:hypothetical protein